MQCKMYCSQWNDMSFPIHTVPCHIVLVGLLIENKSFQFKTLPMLDWNVSLLYQVWNWDKSNCQAFPKKNVVIIYMYYGLFQKKSKEWGHGISKVLKSRWEFQGSSEKEWNFHLIQKNHVEFPWILFFGLGIPKGRSTILWNFLRLSFFFSRICKDTVTNLKISGIF